MVDDEEEIRNILVESIADLGCQTVEAENGKVALELVKKSNYDFIFTDLKMPVMNGLTFLEKLQDLKLKNAPFVIAVSGGVSDEYTLEGNAKLNKLTNAYISKPFDMEEILNILKNPTSKAG